MVRHEDLASHLYVAGIAVVVLTGLAGLCNYLHGRFSAVACERIARALRERLYDRLQRLPCRYHELAQTGDLVQRCTSSIDTETEKAIQQALRTVLRGRISFVIAHRLSTIRSADLIVVIRDGRIVEQGNHHQLITARGDYFDLYTNQFTQQRTEEVLSEA